MKTNKVADEVIEHWYSLVASDNFSSFEVYDLIAKEIAAQKIPGLALSRVSLAEGGALSDNRDYLRMKRERYFFDVCAAPVGVNFFFSYRYYFKPPALKPWEIGVIAFGLWLIFTMFNKIGGSLGIVIFGVIVALILFLMRNAIGMGMRDLDSSLVNTPALGTLYVRYFRKDTYHRQDMRLAYGSIVSTIVKAQIEKLTATRGIQLVREFSYSPVYGALYAMKEKPVGETAPVTPSA